MADDKLLNFNYEGVVFPFVIDGEEEIISQTVESTGVWEENQLSLYEAVIPENGLFIDVGANVGVNSIYAKMKRRNARVIAVEPEPRNFQRLSQNCASLQIELHNMAIADHRGSIGFAGTGTNAHIAASGEHLVPCDTLDGFTERLGVGTIDLIKIDVEGYTDVVLSKAEGTLSRANCAIIEFSHGDILSRLETLQQPASKVLAHSEALFDVLRPHFPYLYYISRRDGLVKLDDTSDLFEIMSSEASVGDILAARVVMPAISALGFAFRNILELKHQNHLRLLEIERLRAER
jgi:FkbM family methyltransferase